MNALLFPNKQLLFSPTARRRYLRRAGKRRNYQYKLLRDGTTTKTLDFTYDNVGMPYSLIYNNGTTTTTYYYITNLQGDVMYLVDADGNEVAAYDYDPYGKVITATGAMAEINSLRYRGYYYDSETSFYYLQSRYYDPEICRFINADSYVSTGQGYWGYNMFAYCLNNPVLYADEGGNAANPRYNASLICDGGTNCGNLGFMSVYQIIKQQEDCGVKGFENATTPSEGAVKWFFGKSVVDTSPDNWFENEILSNTWRMFVANIGISLFSTFALSPLAGFFTSSLISGAEFIYTYESRLGEANIDPGKYTVFHRVDIMRESYTTINETPLKTVDYRITFWFCVPTTSDIYYCARRLTVERSITYWG